MAKKSSIKVRLVPEAKADSPFFYYIKKPTKGEKAKEKLKLKKSLNIWKTEWSNALLEDPTDEYARELIGMVDNVLGVGKSED